MRLQFWGLPRVKKVAVVATAFTALGLLPTAAGATTYNTISNDDLNGAGCTLREAVQASSTNGAFGGCAAGSAGTDEIILSSLYSITTPSTNEDGNADGDIDVGGNGPILIRSATPGTQVDISMGNQVDRMFETTSGSTDLTLRDVVLQTAGNIPTENGGVIDAATAGNQITIERSEINGGNTGLNALNGGGIRIAGAGSELSLTDSIVTGGDAINGGGILIEAGVLPVDITRSTINFNNARSPMGSNSVGGGISSTSVPVTITSSEVTDNTATAPIAGDSDVRGGGISINGAKLTMDRTLVAENQAFSADPGAAAEDGGGIRVVGVGGAAEITNSTISGNTAGNLGTDAGRGGGLFNSGTLLVAVTHTTFSGNLASNVDPAAGGDQIENIGNGLTYTASIIPGGGGVNPCEGVNLTSGGYNALSPDDVCNGGGTADSPTGIIGLAATSPSDNGGPIPTIALNAGGTAVDRVPGAQCATLSNSVDGRDYPRLSGFGGAGCDSGAYERLTCPSGALLNGPGPFPANPCPVAISNPPVVPLPPADSCAGLSGKAKKKCLCKKKKGKKRKKCLKRLKGRKP